MPALSRRGFFRGAGRLHRAARARNRCIRCDALAAKAAQGRAHAHGVRLRAERHDPRRVVAGGRAGTNFALSPTLRRSRRCSNQLQVISGLADVSAEAGPDGAGDHARAGGTFLTGVRIKKTAGSDIHAGVSIDQVVANQIGHLTRFPSLELTCDAVRKAGDCDSGYACAYEYNLAWRSPTSRCRPSTIRASCSNGCLAPARRDERVAQSQAPAGRNRHSILDYVIAGRTPARTRSSTAATGRSSINT